MVLTPQTTEQAADLNKMLALLSPLLLLILVSLVPPILGAMTR
jgi:hypothetical protein